MGIDRFVLNYGAPDPSEYLIKQIKAFTASQFSKRSNLVKSIPTQVTFVVPNELSTGLMMLKNGSKTFFSLVFEDALSMVSELYGDWW